MIHFHIDSRYAAHKFERKLKQAVQATLQHQRAPQAELTVVLTGDARLRALNRQYRGMDKPTDVLSFGDIDQLSESGNLYLGDVVISVPRARAQAKAAGHSLHAELQLLAVHGALHLLGHDHASPAQRRKMWAAQDAILDELGLEIRSAELEARPDVN
ncbi:MAG: rRNA maturation RNase YbeY [Anaerolineales bacterium]|nr:rRNA maturation RNase YbeY [Anaerolineales bacterium]